MLVAWPDGRNINDIDIKDYRDMKKLFFYWNWLARVAQSNSVQRNVVVKSVTSQSPINGKTAILTVATILAIALTTPTTGPSAEIPELPDLPPPPPQREVVLPPFPPGVFDTCLEQYDSRIATIMQGAANWRKSIDNAYYAKRKPFYDAQDRIFDEQDRILAQIEKLNEEWIRLSMSPNSGSAASVARMKQISDEFRAKSKEVEKLQKEIDEINKRLWEIEDWYEEWLGWLSQKTQREEEAACTEYSTCSSSRIN